MPHRGCKHIDITSPTVCAPWVMDCLDRHYKRHDFRQLLSDHGARLYGALPTEERLIIASRVAETACQQIRQRRLVLDPVVIKIRQDGSNGKIRKIGCESALQQCLDFIAVGASEEIRARRIVPQQCSSIKGRGPLYGAQMIQDWILDDVARREYGERHGQRYTLLCTYHAKTDCTKCFQNGDLDAFMNLYSCDCGNLDLLWLFESLLLTHRIDGQTGFMIGALISEWAMQYMLSFAYRHAKDMHYLRRGDPHKCVNHMVTFMDDFLWLGSNRAQLRRAIQDTAEYMADTLRQHVKPNWSIQRLQEHPIDMMGYRIHADGTMAIRSNIFLRSKRIATRMQCKGAALGQCRRLVSYKGFYDHSNSVNANKTYHFQTAFHRASALLSYNEKKGRTQA